jgi:cell division ATPase FtsA
MRLFFLKNKRRKQNVSLAIDIGSEAVKAVIFKGNGKGDKITVLSGAVAYFDKYGFFDGSDFEKDVFKKAIVKAITEARNSLFCSFVEKKIKKAVQKQKRLEVLIGLSPDKLKTRIVDYSVLRKDPKKKISRTKEEKIRESVLNQARKKICQKFARGLGVLPIDIEWLSSKIIGIKIDGYCVPGLEGYEGKNLEFKILSTFTTKYFLKSVKDTIKSLGFENCKILPFAYNLADLLKDKKDGIFVDVGGEVTQIFLVKNGNIEGVDEFKSGGAAFTEAISQALGIDGDSARVLKERYGSGLLGIEVAKKIESIVSREQGKWYQGFKNKVKRLSPKEFSASNVYIFGGGSIMPEIKDILEEKTGSVSRDLPLSVYSKVERIFPKDIKGVEIINLNPNNSQIIPSLLSICNYAKEIF